MHGATTQQGRGPIREEKVGMGIREWRWSGAAVGVLFILAGCGGGSGGADSVGSPRLAAAASVCAEAPFTPNYADGTNPDNGQPNRLFHWPSMPVRIYFAAGDLGTDSLRQQALQGLGWWVAGTRGLISYAVVSSAAQAQITVTFQNMGNNGDGALSTFTYSSGGDMVSASTTFNMSYLSGVASIVPVAAHEFGHALGIDGHSSNPNDVMNPTASVYSLTGLSQRDVNTMLTAYCSAGRSSTPAGAGVVRCRLVK